jgi:hypothetical protein
MLKKREMGMKIGDFASYFNPADSNFHAVKDFKNLAWWQKTLTVAVAFFSSVVPVFGTCAGFRLAVQSFAPNPRESTVSKVAVQAIQVQSLDAALRSRGLQVDETVSNTVLLSKIGAIQDKINAASTQIAAIDVQIREKEEFILRHYRDPDEQFNYDAQNTYPEAIKELQADRDVLKLELAQLQQQLDETVTAPSECRVTILSLQKDGQLSERKIGVDPLLPEITLALQNGYYMPVVPAAKS